MGYKLFTYNDLSKRSLCYCRIIESISRSSSRARISVPGWLYKNCSKCILFKFYFASSSATNNFYIWWSTYHESNHSLLCFTWNWKCLLILAISKYAKSENQKGYWGDNARTEDFRMCDRCFDFDKYWRDAFIEVFCGCTLQNGWTCGLNVHSCSVYL